MENNKTLFDRVVETIKNSKAFVIVAMLFIGFTSFFGFVKSCNDTRDVFTVEPVSEDIYIQGHLETKTLSGIQLSFGQYGICRVDENGVFEKVLPRKKYYEVEFLRNDVFLENRILKIEIEPDEDQIDIGAIAMKSDEFLDNTNRSLESSDSIINTIVSGMKLPDFDSRLNYFEYNINEKWYDCEVEILRLRNGNIILEETFSFEEFVDYLMVQDKTIFQSTEFNRDMSGECLIFYKI